MLAQQTLQLIKTRRTCRSFDKFTDISEKKLNNILEAAIWAPLSIYQLQERKFIVLKGQAREKAATVIVDDPTILKYMRYMYDHQPWGRDEAWENKAIEFAADLGAAPVMVLALTQKNANHHKMEHNLATMWCAAQNMMLQAHAEGLDSGVVTFASEKVKKQLVELTGLNAEKWEPVYILNVGESREDPPPMERHRENVIIVKEK